MKLEDLRLYHLVVESGSFTKAAELADLPITNVSRRIKALEQQLEITLLARTTRQLRPTEEGQAFYQSSKTTLQQFQQSIEELRCTDHELRGRLRVQVFSGAAVAVSTVIEFQERHPHVEMDLVTSEREVDLLENNLDIGMRIGPQRDSSLNGRRVGRLAKAVVASPTYIDNHGYPSHPKDLINHNCLRFRMPNGRLDQQWQVSPDDLVEINGNTIVNDLHCYQQLLLDGKGIGLLPMIVAKPLIEKGTLIKLFPANYEAGEEVWLVYPNIEQRSRLLRAFIDFMLEKLAHDPLLQTLKLG